MAQSKKKRAAKGASGRKANGSAGACSQVPWSGAALYNLGDDRQKGRAVRQVLSDAGFAVRTIRPEKLGDPVGALAGLPGFRSLKRSYTGDVPEEEFMLLSNLPEDRIDALLAAMRQADVQVGCKAVVTRYNAKWPIATLIANVAREHAALAGVSQPTGSVAPVEPGTSARSR